MKRTSPRAAPGGGVSATPNINSTSKLMSPGKAGGGDTVDCSMCGKPYSSKLIDYH